jgi:hypothetical protein
MLVVLAAPAWAYTPESPEVQEMVDKACAFLGTQNWSSPGGNALIGLALYKGGKGKSHAKVKGAIEDAKRYAGEVKSSGCGYTIYDTAICCIFLSEVDPQQYRPEIQIYVNALLKRQMPNGCWHYDSRYDYDDTSQTQYGALSLWYAHQNGLYVPVQAVEGAMNWFLRTQDASGAFGYNVKDPGSMHRVRQPNVSHSMAAAGLGSVYVCCHLLGFRAKAKVEKKKDVPPAFAKVERKQERQDDGSLRPQNTSPAAVRSCQEAGNAWFAQNLKFDVPKWTHYYMYALERYMSFRELIEGRVVAEPEWYSQGARYLKETQKSSGSWSTAVAHGSGTQIDTAFAVLFLTRSSQKTIRKSVPDEGLLVGGMGMPKNMANARMKDGQVVTPQAVRDVDDLLEMLEETDNPDFDPKAFRGVPLDEDLTKRNSQLVRLRELVTVENATARLAAVKTLARARDLDNVPILIFALSDPYWRVALEARDGLRFISRKIEGYGLPREPTEQQVIAVQEKWKAWYLSIRPDAELVE